MANVAEPVDETEQGAFSVQMRAAAHATWSAAVNHRFFREVAADRVADDVFARYLRVEYGFVDCASIVLGYAVAKAPSFAERRKLAFGLYGLVTDQENFFVEAFERMNLPPALRVGLPPNDLSGALHRVFLGAAENEGYEEILACILAAEWMYLAWSATANKTPSSRAYVRDWVTLHAGGAFADHVAWVRSEIDARAPSLGPRRQARLRALFERALAAEITFHDAAYSAG